MICEHARSRVHTHTHTHTHTRTHTHARAHACVLGRPYTLRIYTYSHMDACASDWAGASAHAHHVQVNGLQHTRTMCRSMGSSGFRMCSTASVTMSVKRSAIFSLSCRG